MSDDKLILVLFLLGTIIFCLVYMAPSIVAFKRNHPNRWLILVINFAFGGTIIGWGVSLVWALRAVHRLGAAADGGESGLNIFANDPKKVQLSELPPMPASIGHELERLDALLAKGSICQSEFDVLKARLIQL
ncbi:MAG: superinfection immunity protein [Rhizobiaceae bacterium]|jgi:hypothetical protein|nr:superinfection immunity protein [Pseudomonadota bacterium]